MKNQLIYSYTREQAIQDALLIDLSNHEVAKMFTCPVACTASVWAIIQMAVANPRENNDLEGVLFDMLYMAAHSRPPSARDSPCSPFCCRAKTKNTAKRRATCPALLPSPLRVKCQTLSFDKTDCGQYLAAQPEVSRAGWAVHQSTKQKHLTQKDCLNTSHWAVDLEEFIILFRDLHWTETPAPANEAAAWLLRVNSEFYLIKEERPGCTVQYSITGSIHEGAIERIVITCQQLTQPKVPMPDDHQIMQPQPIYNGKFLDRQQALAVLRGLDLDQPNKPHQFNR